VFPNSSPHNSFVDAWATTQDVDEARSAASWTLLLLLLAELLFVDKLPTKRTHSQGWGIGTGVPLDNRLRGLGERRELPQWGPG